MLKRSLSSDVEEVEEVEEVVSKKPHRSDRLGPSLNSPAVILHADEVVTALELFAEKFVQVFEQKVKDHHDGVIGTKEKKSGILSKLVTLGCIGGGARVVASVATFGKSSVLSSAVASGSLLVGNAIDESVNRVIKVFQDRDSSKFLSRTMGKQTTIFPLREVLIRSAVEIFSRYESQYVQMLSKGSAPRKLSIDVLGNVAARRAVRYIRGQASDIQTDDQQKFLSELYNVITKGVVLGNSKKRRLQYKASKCVTDIADRLANLSTRGQEGDLKSHDEYMHDEGMYSQAGLVQISGDDIKYYIREKGNGTSNTTKYGYRLPFEWESGLDGWKQEESEIQVQYKYTLDQKIVSSKAESISRAFSEKVQLERSDLKEIASSLDQILEKLAELSHRMCCNPTVKLLDKSVQNLVPLHEDQEGLEKRLLGISNEEEKHAIRELEKNLSVTEASQLALAYIYREKAKFRRRGGPEFLCSGYFDKLSENLPGFGPQCGENHGVEVQKVAAAYSITLEKIKEAGPLGTKGLELIEIAVYLGSGRIDVEKVFAKLGLYGSDELWDSFELLEQFSLIYLQSGQLIIAGLVQEAVKLKLKREGREEEVLKRIVEKLDIVGTSEAITVSIWKWYVAEYDVLRCKLLDRFKNLADRERGSVLSLLVSHNQCEAAQRILREIDDDIRERIVDISGAFLESVAQSNAIGILRYLVGEKKLIIPAGQADGTAHILRIALSRGSLDVLKYLIDERNIRVLDSLSIQEILYFAASSGQKDMMKYLVQEKQFTGEKVLVPLLFFAIFNGYSSIVEYIIEDVRCFSLEFSTSFFSFINLAACSNKVDIMKYLIAKEENFSFYLSVDKVKLVAFSAASANALDVLKYLLENSYLTVHRDLRDSIDLLFFAAQHNASDVVDYLIVDKKMLDFEVEGKFISFCVRLVEFFDWREISPALGRLMDGLMERGNQYEGQDYPNQNVITSAVIHDRDDLLDYLVGGRDVVELSSDDAYSILYNAIQNGSGKIVRYFVEKKKIIDSNDKDSIFTSIDLAIEFDMLCILEYLVETFKILQDQSDLMRLIESSIEFESELAVEHIIHSEEALSLCSPTAIMSLLKLAVKCDFIYVVKFLVESKKVVDLEQNKGNIDALVVLATENNALVSKKYLEDLLDSLRSAVGNYSDEMEVGSPRSSLSSVTVSNRGHHHTM